MKKLFFCAFFALASTALADSDPILGLVTDPLTLSGPEHVRILIPGSYLTLYYLSGYHFSPGDHLVLIDQDGCNFLLTSSSQSSVSIGHYSRYLCPAIRFE
jgi:hypothetical protein